MQRVGMTGYCLVDLRRGVDGFEDARGRSGYGCLQHWKRRAERMSDVLRQTAEWMVAVEYLRASQAGGDGGSRVGW